MYVEKFIIDNLDKQNKILIIGGNAECSGAPTLAGLSALATGSDLVTIISPESAATMIKKSSPDLIVKFKFVLLFLKYLSWIVY